MQIAKQFFLKDVKKFKHIHLVLYYSMLKIFVETNRNLSRLLVFSI